MDHPIIDGIEIAPASVVLGAARDFAGALAETPQFRAFEQAAEHFRLDKKAQQAQKAYQEKQTAWKALMMLDALSPEQRAELKNLRSTFVNLPVVQEYINAQTELTMLCQAAGDILSEAIGFNFAAACGVSCCG